MNDVNRPDPERRNYLLVLFLILIASWFIFSSFLEKVAATALILAAYGAGYNIGFLELMRIFQRVSEGRK